MNIKVQLPKLSSLRPRITVVGVGGAGSNAVNNMIAAGLAGVNFVVANTDAQSLAVSTAENRIQLGAALTEGLGAGARPEVGRAAAEETLEEIRAQVAGSHMVFVAAGMGGGTGTGAAAVIARVARECGALAVGVVTKPFHFEGTRRMRAAEAGIAVLKPEVDTLIVIPNQNLFRIANERTTFSDAFVLADQVLYSGIACVVDLIVKEGLINLDFADVRTIMSGMGTALMGTGEASGERRAVIAAEEAISNPLLDDISLRGAKGLLVSITGNRDLTLYEVDEAATRVRQEVDGEANIIVGATFDDTLGDRIRVSIVASGMDRIAEPEAPAQGRSIPAPQPAAAPDIQPPFIEPYPSPYHAEAETAMPAASYPAQAPQVSKPVPLPMPQQAPQAVLAELPQGPRHQQSEPDLTRALSEALNSHGENEGAYAPHPPERWTAPSGAVFTESPQISHGSQAHQLQQAATYPPARDHAPPNDAGFQPQPPAETRRVARRMPEVDEFPAVGQREFHSKAGQYASPPQTPPRAYAQPAPVPPRKLSFFERLTGGRRKSTVNAQDQVPYPQAEEHAGAARDHGLASGHGQPAESHRGASSRDDDVPELPVFFGSDRK